MRIYSHAGTAKALSTVSAELFEFSHEKIMRVARIAYRLMEKKMEGEGGGQESANEGGRDATSSLINEEAKQLAPQR